MKTISDKYDVMIIGGGPAGMSAGLWCADLGLRSIILEKEPEFGGQLLRTYNPIRNYIGIADASGKEIRDRFLQQVEQTHAEKSVRSDAVRVDLALKIIELADGMRLQGKSIIIATGVRRRRLEVPGEREFEGRGILTSGVRDRESVKGKSVMIVGGGDAALENAIILGKTAKYVTVVHRRGKFTARPDFIEVADQMPNVSFQKEMVVKSIAGGDKLEEVELQNARTGEVSRIPVDAVLIRIGVVPNSDLFNGQIDMEDLGYIRIDPNCRTNVDRVFAIGDVANPISPTINSAAGMGTTAAKNIELLIKAI